VEILNRYEYPLLNRFQMEYIPAVGDRVEARSKGDAGEGVAVVYTDDWFLGQITKVNILVFALDFTFRNHSLCLYAGHTKKQREASREILL